MYGGMPGMPGGMDMQAMMQNMGGMEGLQNMMGGMGGGPPGMEDMPEMNEDEVNIEKGKDDVSGILNDLEKKEDSCCNNGICSNKVDCKVETEFKNEETVTDNEDNPSEEPQIISI